MPLSSMTHSARRPMAAAVAPDREGIATLTGDSSTRVARTAGLRRCRNVTAVTDWRPGKAKNRALRTTKASV